MTFIPWDHTEPLAVISVSCLRSVVGYFFCLFFKKRPQDDNHQELIMCTPDMWLKSIGPIKSQVICLEKSIPVKSQVSQVPPQETLVLPAVSSLYKENKVLVPVKNIYLNNYTSCSKSITMNWLFFSSHHVSGQVSSQVFSSQVQVRS